MSAPSRARFNRPQSKTRRPAGTTAVSLFRDDTVPTRVVGWLADLKSLLNVSVQTFWACQSGGTSKLSSRGLSDALMSPFGENPTATLIASGEAKRPDTPKGVHPLVASEVRDAIERAQLFSDTSTSTARHSRVTDRRRPTPQTRSGQVFVAGPYIVGPVGLTWRRAQHPGPGPPGRENCCLASRAESGW